MLPNKQSTGLRIFAVHIGHQLSHQEWDKFILSIPVEDRIRIENYKSWMDRQRTLLGTALVKWSIQKLAIVKQGFRTVRDENGRPYIDGNYSWQGDFNLSHSGEWIVVAFAEKGKVGIDVERIGPLNEAVMEYALTQAEWNIVSRLKDEDKTTQFYEIWTKKEAMYKTGLFPSAIPKSLDTFQMKGLYTHLFYIDPSHPVSVCWDQEKLTCEIVILDREELILYPK
ncbi:4'-phosphopantetheinyl transferase family protein [Lederbergia lenta]|uniref:4'-phosphopantetheinyl transferase family protein n=1 Tax=Lederbergia lenta TaxID=1467 RepID=UPI00204246CD|nr:4'-phosphopantetheinyl transferase superfamily protein [Lederbergia lenta]MCM3112253.1 4'-phosphopantetheinyl transferase superfamily protein [Lederbergia lenta]